MNLEASRDLQTLYRIFAHVCGLYAESANLARSCGFDESWIAITDSTLNDLAKVCSAWEQRRDEVVKNDNDTENALAVTLERHATRLERLEKLVHPFVPMLRWTKILDLLERRWIRELTLTIGHLPRYSPNFQPLKKNSETRLQLIAKIQEKLISNQKNIAQSFAIPKSIAPAGYKAKAKVS